MKKLFLLATLIFVAQPSFADGTLIAKTDVKVLANSDSTRIAEIREENSSQSIFQCDLGHDVKDFERTIKKDSTFTINLISQAEYKPMLVDEAKRIIEDLGGTYHAERIKNSEDAINEILKLGGKVNVINGKLITHFKKKSNIELVSAKTNNTYVLRCLSDENLSVDDLMNALYKSGSLAPQSEEGKEL